MLTIISQVRKKYQKGKTAIEAAEDLEKELSIVQMLYDLIVQNPASEDDEILIKYKEMEI